MKNLKAVLLHDNEETSEIEIYNFEKSAWENLYGIFDKDGYIPKEPLAFDYFLSDCEMKATDLEAGISCGMPDFESYFSYYEVKENTAHFLYNCRLSSIEIEAIITKLYK